MSPEAIVSTGGLAFVLISAIAGGSYFMGGHARELKNLKDRQDRAEAENATRDRELNALKVSMGAVQVLTSKVEAVESALREIGHDIKNLLTGKIQPARRRSGED